MREVGGGRVGAFKECEQGRVRIGGGANRVVIEYEFSQILVEPRRIRLDPGLGEPFGRGIGIGIEDRIAAARAAGPEARAGTSTPPSARPARS